jgi:long-chain acyl-CoA synthetase
VGRPLDGVEVRIADDTGRTLGARQTGELCVRGQNVMLGYYKLPHETEKTIIDGWLHTGDMGYLDDDGYIFLVERKKDLIIRGGFNIFPGEVEQVLMEHPGVAEAAVAGMVNDTYGEEVKAFVVLRKGASVPESEIIEYCRVRLAAYKCPRAVEFRSSLPRNIRGKVLRRQLRENQAPS